MVNCPENNSAMAIHDFFVKTENCAQWFSSCRTMLIMSILTLLSGCTNVEHSQRSSDAECDFCGFRQTALREDIIFLEYIHNTPGRRHEEAITALQEKAKSICEGKGFAHSRFAQRELLDLMKISSPHIDNFTALRNGHAAAYAHVLCSGSATQLIADKNYLMKCNADSHCLSVDEDVVFPPLHNDTSEKFFLDFQNLIPSDQPLYEHRILFMPDGTLTHQPTTESTTAVEIKRSFSIDFKFTDRGLQKNIQPAEDGVSWPYGQLGSFRGWLIARASRPQSQWFFLTFEPATDEKRLIVAVSRVSNESVQVFQLKR